MSDRVPCVSVGMPVYNGAPYLRRTLDSILGQTLGDFELVISDNASTDDTGVICRSVAATDRRVRYERNPENVGATENYNAVFQRSRAPYFKWASANDLCEPTFLERCLAVLEARSDVVLCYPRTRLFDETSGTVTDYQDDLDLQDADPVARFVACVERMRLNNVMNGVIRRSALASTGLMKPFRGSDCSMIAELTLHGKFVEVTERLFYRRMEAGAVVNLKSAEEQHRHWDPRGRGALRSPKLKMMRDHYRAAWRAPLNLRERMRLYARLLKWTRWSRDELASELWQAAIRGGRRYRGGSL